jgi:hypothetical protein
MAVVANNGANLDPLKIEEVIEYVDAAMITLIIKVMDTNTMGMGTVLPKNAMKCE